MTALPSKVRKQIQSKLPMIEWKRLLIKGLPYIIFGYVVNKEYWLYRHIAGGSLFGKLQALLLNFNAAFQKPLPSIHPMDVLAGGIGGAALWAFITYRRKNAKKYRQGVEYGSARWGNEKDIKPFIDPVFENNILLTQTERLTMNGRPPKPQYARNKNVVVIGGSGSGKTRFYVKPNLMQMGEKISYVVTDPKGYIYRGQRNNHLLKSGYFSILYLILRRGGRVNEHS